MRVLTTSSIVCLLARAAGAMGEATTPLKTDRPERKETARVENRILFEFGLVSVGVEVVR